MCFSFCLIDFLICLYWFGIYFDVIKLILELLFLRNVIVKSVNLIVIRVFWVKVLKLNGKINYKFCVCFSGEKEEENCLVYEGNDIMYLVIGL